MKNCTRAPLLLLILLLSLSLCACGLGRSLMPQPAPTQASPAPTAPPAASDSPLSPYAGKYSFHCTYMSPEYVDGMFTEYGLKANKVEETFVQSDTMKDYTITLKPDGTGYLYWGSANQGPIDYWSMDGDALQFKAGVAVFDGSIVDGYMTVESEPGFVLFFAAPGAKLPDVPLVSMDDYIELLYSRREYVPSAENLAGLYYCYAMSDGQYRIRLDDFGQTEDGSINLREDGTGVMITGGVGNSFLWALEDGQMHWYDESGALSMDDMLHFELVSEGVFTLRRAGQDFETTYAKADADVSAVHTISPAEYRALTGQG